MRYYFFPSFIKHGHLCIFVCVLLHTSVTAVIPPPPPPKIPLTVRADSIIYNPKEQICTATGHVKITRGSIRISGNIIKVFFITKEKKNIQAPTSTPESLKISHVEITGNAYIRMDKSEILGGHAVWHVNKKSLHISQKPHLKTADGLSLYATTLHYDGNTQKGKALGAVHMEKDQKSLICDSLLFSFGPIHKSMPPVLQTLYAQGNVLWKEKNVLLFCKKAEYSKATEKIIAQGNVRILQGENFLVGEQAFFHIPTHHISVISDSNQQVCVFWTPPKKAPLQKQEKKS